MKKDSVRGWRRSHFSSEVTEDLDGEEVTLLGWVQEVRDLGGIRFVILQDKEGNVQITVPKRKTSSEVLSKSLTLQKRYAIGVKGIARKTSMTPRGIEIIPKTIAIFSAAAPNLPIDISGKTPAHIDVRLDARSLDLCQEENVAVFRVQHEAVSAIRTFLFQRGFIEVHTPRIIASATEGGASLFSVNYFNKKAFLAQSPQLYKEQLVMSFEKVFEIGPFFRAEESHTRHHISEFVSVDIEQAFAEAKDVMQLLEQLVRHICITINEECRRELKKLNHSIEVPETPFERLKYDEAIQELKNEGYEIQWGDDISTPAFRVLGKLHSGFYFITEWPTHSKAFYIKPREDNPKICEGFDLMWRWMELVSGGSRIADRDLLEKRLREKELNPDSFLHHLQAFDYGMPPHAGWAIGLERLTMMLTGKKNIRETTLYPRDQFRLTP